MARKKPSPAGKKSKKPLNKVSLEKLPDRRTVEGMLRQAVSGLTGSPNANSPLQRAQDLMYQAFDEPDPDRRVQLAQQALAISNDCADAYTLLAEHTRSRKETLRLYQEGVAAGERALGPAVFQRDAGNFWGILETRPYMRARLGLAYALWTDARREEAVDHLQDMLRLNPGDNQGVRYSLASFLLFLDRDDDLHRLLDQYPDEDSATWAYTRALLAFRRHGDAPEARELLKAARKANRHVPAYLTGDKFPPAESPGYYTRGHDSEAVEYVSGFLLPWRSTPGAAPWVRETLTAKKRKAQPAAHGPLELAKRRLKDTLPQQAHGWHVALRQAPGWIDIGGRPVRPWIVLVINRSNQLVIGLQLLEQAPSAELLWDSLAAAMQRPVAGKKHRPSELYVEADERWESLRPHLEEIGIRLVTDDGFEELQDLIDTLGKQIGIEKMPRLLDSPGVTPAEVGSFFEAAAFFFREAPWRKVGFEQPIRIDSNKFQDAVWYGVLMGQSGLTSGLAIYEVPPDLRRAVESEGDLKKAAERTVCIAVMFGEEWTLPVNDLDAAKKYGWPVARPDAYPRVFHKDSEMDMRPPLPWELELMEGCLRAVPRFVALRRQDDPARETITVPVAAGELTLTLSWLIEEDQ
jgi:hypothetical protein